MNVAFKFNFTLIVFEKLFNNFNMCTTFKLLNAVSLQCNINANCALDASADNRYCLIVEDGLYILRLCGLMDTLSPSISFTKLFITIPEYSPSANLEIDLGLFLSDLSQNELYETILNVDISENVKDATHVKQQPAQVKWSPTGLISRCQSAIACMTNRGALDIFVHTINEVEVEEYVSVANITKKYISHVKASWSGVSGNPSKLLSVLKSRLYEVLPTAFEWSNMITNNNIQYCLLFVVHLNGDISVWKIDQRKLNEINDTGIKLISIRKTYLTQITALTWLQLGHSGLLLIGNLEGRVQLISVTNITSDSLSFGKNVCLWNESDQIRVEYFRVIAKHGMTYIFIIKGSFLLICLINEVGDILDIHNFHAGNLQISGLEHLEDNLLLVLTHTGIIKEIKLMVEDNKLRIDWRNIYVEFPWHLYRTHGLIVSKNKVYLAVLVSMGKINDIRRKKAHTKLLIFKNMGKDPLNILMKNSSESLMSYWDCLEILRLTGVIEKKLPCEGLPSGLNYDKLTTTQLKICLWLAKSSETLYDKATYLLEEYNLLRSDELKYILKIKLSVKHMKHLFHKIIDGNKLNEFHMQSLDIINMYLKEIVVDDVIPSLGLGKNTITELQDVISAANEVHYPAPPKCVLCNEDIIGSSCLPPHMDTRCSISFMQVIDLPYYKCHFCNSIVHWKLTDIYSIITCPFCDITMDFVSMLENSRSHKNYTTSSCSNDCAKESIDIGDIENHAFTDIEKQGEYVNLVAISSSDEEEESFHEDSNNDIHHTDTAETTGGTIKDER